MELKEVVLLKQLSCNKNKKPEHDQRQQQHADEAEVDDHMAAGADTNTSSDKEVAVQPHPCKQFWKAGDYHINHSSPSSYSAVGMDHVRVHPRFLHSNATSHKWALGAFAELLDNALDEVCNGSTYVKVDRLLNSKDQNKMLLFQDDGGGMSPDKMRQCMSLGFSAKSKIANTIGQYGNGFKTSTMRLGADVIVFSRCRANHSACPTRSIGMLSYTFLRDTGKEDIVVPAVDYVKKGDVWTKLTRSSLDDWHMNLDALIKWSPYSNEQELLHQFNTINNQGTRIIIYNLWEDDMGLLELDFDADPADIQIRGVNRDEKKIAMARQYPNSKHFLTYQHSLRNYASILYLRLPLGFRIILRGKDVEHHSLVNDMIHKREHTYRPKLYDGKIKDLDLSSQDLIASVTLGFAKDAEDHIDIQGFNVYHKNRLIKPFWRVWNAAGSDGRGVIGVLEANFVEPAHDKQGFEKTTALSRLEDRLVHLQKTYWRENCHQIGYAPRRCLNKQSSSPSVASPSTSLKRKGIDRYDEDESAKCQKRNKLRRIASYDHSAQGEGTSTSHHLESPQLLEHRINTQSKFKTPKTEDNMDASLELNAVVVKLRRDNELKTRSQNATGSTAVEDLLCDLQYEIDRRRSLETELEEAKKKLRQMDKEQEELIQIFSDERNRRDIEEEKLRKRLQVASETIQEFLDKHPC